VELGCGRVAGVGLSAVWGGCTPSLKRDPCKTNTSNHELVRSQSRRSIVYVYVYTYIYIYI
jgi:hypothetical protein